MYANVITKQPLRATGAAVEFVRKARLLRALDSGRNKVKYVV